MKKLISALLMIPFVLGCGGGGGGSSSEPTLMISSSEAVPGSFITIEDDSIKEEEALDVTFENKSGYEVTIKTILTKDGDAEGMPNVILEAAASGVIVVASDHEGIRDFMREGRTGFACPENDPRSASAAIRRALEMRGSWDEIASRARRLVRAEYDARLSALRLKEMYWELLSKTRQN